MTLTQKKLDVTVKLGKGTYGQSGFDTVKLSGYRVHAQVVVSGGFSMGTAEIRVYGMPLALMNQLATLGARYLVPRSNEVILEAGDDHAGMAVMFQGTIGNAWAEFLGMPQVCFVIVAYTGLFELTAPAAPRSYPGSADVAVIIANIAADMGRTFSNNGVSVILTNPYFPGTLLDQLRAATQAAGVDYADDGTTITIWPKNGSRTGAATLVSAATGMVGYPSFSNYLIVVRVVFNPLIRYGDTINVQTQHTPASGDWVVRVIMHSLASETPDGPWFSDIQADAPGRTSLV